MQCPKCQFENPEGAKFCVECGNKIEIKCSSVNSPNFKFCSECGQKLSIPSEAKPTDFSLDEKLTKIQKYLPKGLTEKILSKKDRIEGERKQVTVMFCDMERFTQLSERLGPEEAYTIMDRVYEILIHKVHDYEGIVNELTGDGIMALFGAPIALEDAPQRAIRSAIKKQDQAKIPQIKMRIGIHTGPVVVGTLGNDLRVDFKAVGDTVNLASRVEGLAEPGTTCVTEDIFKLSEGFFRFERTKSGRGQAFSIIGEAGVGKSRLLFEFRKAVANEGVTFLDGKCLAFSRGVAYHPVIDILKSTFDISSPLIASRRLQSKD